MKSATWLTFVAATILLSLAPGPGAMNTVSAGIRYGTRSALPSIFGLQAGLAISIVLVGLGIGSLIASSMVFFTLLKTVGSLYLIYLGLRKWQTSGSSTPFAATSSTARPFRFTRALFINLTNPKAIAFLVALFPQFIDPSRPQALQFLILGSTMIAVDTLVMFGYACLAARCVRWFKSQRVLKIIDRGFGLAFIGTGLLLATTGRYRGQ